MATDSTPDKRDSGDADGADAAEAKPKRRRWPRIRRWLWRSVAALAVVLVLLISVVLFRTWRFQSRQPTVSPAAPLAADFDVEAAARRLGEMVRFKTVTRNEAAAGIDVYQPVHDFLAHTYPLVHQTMTRETIAESSLLYTWTGTEPNLPPVILVAHMDVVPAQPENLDKWTYPPFSGQVADGFIWGRGTLDDKLSVMGWLEAAERLIARGFAPRRTVYLAFGHDEERNGIGAKSIAETLAQRGVRAALALDEGHILTQGVVDGIDVPLASIGIAEKGFLTLELTAHAESGHSSVPPRRTAVGALSKAISRLEQNPMSATLAGVGEHMLAYLGPEMPFVQRMAMANLWLFGGMVTSTFAANDTTNALLRTTTAPTMLQAGTKHNVLPAIATGTINFRIRPGDTVASVIAHVRRVIADERIDIEVVEAHEPSPVSDPESAAFKLLQRTTRQVFSGSVVTPALVVGMTDGRFYQSVAENVFRFLPVVFGPDDIARLHGLNERIPVTAYGQLIHFYIQLLSNLQELQG